MMDFATVLTLCITGLLALGIICLTLYSLFGKIGL